MFTKMKNIDTAFRSMRLLSFFVIVAALLFSGFVYYQNLKMTSASQSKIYVLVNGKAVEALAGDRKENIPVEAKDHIRDFHRYFFTLDPDEKLIQANMTRALYLADGSAKKTYDNLKENGYYANIISGNISQEIEIDSVVVSTQQHPYYFRCYARQQIIRATSIVHRSLITEGYLRSINRSDNNSHGFLIERWATLENRDLKTQSR